MRRFRLDLLPMSVAASDPGHSPIEIEITTDGDSADDALVCAILGNGKDDVGEGGAAPDAMQRGGRMIYLEEVIDIRCRPSLEKGQLVSPPQAATTPLLLVPTIPLLHSFLL
jgi:hypothetical protein